MSVEVSTEEAGPIQEWHSVEELEVDSRYQRALNQDRVKKIASLFDPDLFDSVTVSHRSNGETVLLNGQHRAAALKLMGWGAHQKVPCLCHFGLSPEREAEIFLGLQTGQQVGALDKFRAALFAKDAVALEINRIVTDEGFSVGASRAKFAIAAVDALRTVYALGVLSESLSTIRKAWDDDPFGTSMHILQGVGKFIAYYRPLLDLDRVVEVLSRHAPRVWMAKSSALQEGAHSTGLPWRRPALS